ncbi:hypothetical protein ICE98_00908 [Lactococcus lactis]|nr:hypothetical protein [Lactococcus lactis]
MDKDFYKLVTQKLAEKTGMRNTRYLYCMAMQNPTKYKRLFSSDVEAANGMFMKQHTTGIKVSYI